MVLGAIISFLVITDIFYVAILPSHLHNTLLQPLHQPEEVVVDIKIVDCLKISTCSQGEGWFKVPTDLRLGESWTAQTFVFINRVNKEILDMDKIDGTIKDIAISNRNDTYLQDNTINLPEKVYNEIKTHTAEGKPLDFTNLSTVKSLGWDKLSHNLWVKRGKYDPTNCITGVDVLFSNEAVDPRPGWELQSSPLDVDHSKDLAPYLTIRKGYKFEVPKPHLKFTKEHKYKILQVSDLHFSTGFAECIDPFPPETKDGCIADQRSLKFVKKVLKLEKPDLIILTGDLVYGKQSPDTKTALFKAVSPFIENKIPWGMVLGNHDHQGSLNRKQIMDLASTLPYSVSERGPEDAEGEGNYVLKVMSKNNHPGLSLYLLDTHSYSTNPKVKGYDWLRLNQLRFVEDQYFELLPEQKKYVNIPLSMAFFHIPLTEYRETTNKPIIGSYKEGSTAPNFNTGGRQIFDKVGVSVISVGHDHCNDFCMLDTLPIEDGKHKAWLCHGGAAGEGGYGGYGGTARRLRVFEIDGPANMITTWKRVEGNEGQILDKQVLVNNEVVNSDYS